MADESAYVDFYEIIYPSDGICFSALRDLVASNFGSIVMVPGVPPQCVLIPEMADDDGESDV